MESPIEKFRQWWGEALANSPLQQKSAVCISTLDADGFPHGRFVDLKSVDEHGFTFCTYLDSAKGKHILANPKTAMTVWWDHLGYQVRVVGEATPISEKEADEIWTTRKRAAQLTTAAFQQSQPLFELGELETRFKSIEDTFSDIDIPRPAAWSGYCVRPLSIEFLTFMESRLHIRELYRKKGNIWVKSLLQP